MLKKSLSFLSIVLVLALIAYPSLVRSQKRALPKQRKTIPARDDSSCYTCHELIKSLKEENKHGSLPCSKCHGKLNEHLKDSDKPPRDEPGPLPLRAVSSFPVRNADGRQS